MLDCSRVIRTYSDSGVWVIKSIIRSANGSEAKGTVHSAIHFCLLLGIKSIKMIGFDGTGGYAPCLEQDVPLGGGRHGLIRSDSKRLFKLLDLDGEFVDPIGEVTQSSHVMPSVVYEELYDRLRKEDYHRKEDDSSHMASHIPWIVNNLDVQTVLDIGCSTGKSLELLGEHHLLATGVEVSSIAVERAQALGRNVVQGCATQLPFDDGQFDLVCSADVFEHLHPDDAQNACREACRVANHYVFLKIAEREDATEKWKSLAGHPLHLTTQPIEWWKQWCQPYGSIVRLERELICIDVSKHCQA
jgi:SAM-dependent methyltransferase